MFSQVSLGITQFMKIHVNMSRNHHVVRSILRPKLILGNLTLHRKKIKQKEIFLHGKKRKKNTTLTLPNYSFQVDTRHALSIFVNTKNLYITCRQSGAYAQILSRILAYDFLQFGLVFLVILLAFSVSFYLALRGDADLHVHTETR